MFIFRAGKGMLPYDPVLILYGDSQARGQADDQAGYVSSYVADSKVKILNAAGAFVDYTPGTSGGSGLAYGANDNAVGPEIGFIRRFRAAYPNNTLYIIKEGNGGSFQTRGISDGTLTASVTGNILTPTVGSGAAGGVLVGPGLSGLYMPFTAGGATFYVWDVGGTGYTKGNFASTALTRYPGSSSWSSTEGLAYNGHSASITNGARARALAALTALTGAGKTPRIITAMVVLGTNDKGNTTTANAFETDSNAFIARIKADLPLSNAKITLTRVTSSGVAPATVRTAQAAVKAANANTFLLDSDGYALSADAVHWRIAGLDAMGANAFDCTVGLASGL